MNRLIILIYCNAKTICTSKHTTYLYRNLLDIRAYLAVKRRLWVAPLAKMTVRNHPVRVSFTLMKSTRL